MKVRMKFSKEGSMRFIGHLDVMRYFQKAFRRGKVPMAFSQGFSPHPLLSFASPLGIGLESTGEYLDLTLLPETMDLDQLKASINEQMNEEIHVELISPMPERGKNGMSLVAGADYSISFKEKEIETPWNKDWKKTWETFLQQQEILMTKETKKETKVVDLKPNIYQVQVEEDALVIRLSAGSVENVKPQTLLLAFCEWNRQPFSFYQWKITRLDLFGGTKENLLPLSEYFGEPKEKEE